MSVQHWRPSKGWAQRLQGAGSSWIGTSSGGRLLPGDTVVVPENLDRYRLTRAVKDWTQIFYQFALGVAGLKVLKDL